MGHKGISNVENQSSIIVRRGGKGLIRRIFENKRANSLQKEIIVSPLKKIVLN